MIARLYGKLIEKNTDNVIIDVNGVGYLVLVTLFTLQQLPDTNQDVTLFIHTYVREESLSLFGFSCKEEREFFVTLMGVTKVGAKMARNILSGIRPKELCSAIETEDVAVLKKIPGVGVKLAQRLILELKDKLKLSTPKELKTDIKSAHGPLSDVYSALENLGYPPQKINSVLGKMKKNEDIELLSLGKAIKIALKALSES